MAGICKSIKNTVVFGTQTAASVAEIFALGGLTAVEVTKPILTAVRKEIPAFTQATEIAVHTAALNYREWVLPTFIDASNDAEMKAWCSLSSEQQEEFIAAYQKAMESDGTNAIMAKGFSEVNGKLVYQKPVPVANP